MTIGRFCPSDHPVRGSWFTRAVCFFTSGSAGRHDRPGRVRINRARARGGSSTTSARDGVWPDVRCRARLSSPEDCGGRFLPEPVRSPLRPRHPCALEYTKQCRRVAVYRVVGSRKRPRPKCRREVSRKPEPGNSPERNCSPQARDFVLLSSDLRDITDCPQDCQPDWSSQFSRVLADIRRQLELGTKTSREFFNEKRSTKGAIAFIYALLRVGYRGYCSAQSP